MIDCIVLGWMLYLFLSGWQKGIVCTLVGPFSLVLGILGSILYFQKTHNIIWFMIGIFTAPLIVAVILSIVMSLWNKQVDKNIPPEFLSRLLGALFNMAWGGSLAIITLMTIPLLPQFFNIENIKQKVTESYGYSFIKNHSNNELPLIKDIEALSVISQNQSKLEEVQSRPEVQSFYNNERIKDITSDKELMDQMKEKNIVKLLANPKIRAILQDEDLAEKIMALKKAILDKEPTSLPPKVYESK